MTAAPGVLQLGPRTLRGRAIALEPLADNHLAGLAATTDADTFRHFPTPDFDSWLAKSRTDAAGSRLTFAVRRLGDGAILGSTAYFNISEKDRRVEIGWTWYAREVQGTSVNPEAKLLLLTNAFEAGYNCVVLRTGSLNMRSRAAIAKLGARQDGILRAAVWMPPSPARDGYFRDSVFFSILASEWPDVRANLEKRLEQGPA